MLTLTTLLRWGNYDTVNNAVQWLCSEVPTSINPLANACPGVTGQPSSLPPSFYLSAKPAWWGSSPPWPAVGPDVTGGNVQSGTGTASTLGGRAYKIPARLCYESTAPDSAYGTANVLLFNATSCYGQQSASAPPATPTTLNVQ